jgi:hypothetical protein
LNVLEDGVEKFCDIASPSFLLCLVRLAGVFPVAGMVFGLVSFVSIGLLAVRLTVFFTDRIKLHLYNAGLVSVIFPTR